MRRMRRFDCADSLIKWVYVDSQQGDGRLVGLMVWLVVGSIDWSDRWSLSCTLLVGIVVEKRPPFAPILWKKTSFLYSNHSIEPTLKTNYIDRIGMLLSSDRIDVDDVTDFGDRIDGFVHYVTTR